jgi:hypothetical protein
MKYLPWLCLFAAMLLITVLVVPSGSISLLVKPVGGVREEVSEAVEPQSFQHETQTRVLG